MLGNTIKNKNINIKSIKNNTIILHNNEIDKGPNYVNCMEILNNYLLSNTNTNIIIFNFNKQNTIKTPTSVYLNNRLIYITLNHIDSPTILEKMFQYNIPFINNVHKLYNFNIISNFYKYILINNHLKNYDLIPKLNNVILYTRFNVFIDNILYFNKKISEDINKYKRNPKDVEDIYYILYKSTFLTFLDSFEGYNILKFFSTINITYIEYPEYILSLFIDKYKVIEDKGQYINSKMLKFSQNMNKYSITELYERLDEYIKYSYTNHKLILFKNIKNENIFIDLHDESRIEKYKQIHFRFISWSCPNLFTKEDMIEYIEKIISY
jgi:hypothetical protein